MSTKKERTREHILDASYELFAKHGFNKITMKDICEATGLSRGGLYSHFPGTKEIFEAILEKLNQKEEMDFDREIAEGKPATEILRGALLLMEEEMLHAEDSLSLAMYEYAGTYENGFMNDFNKIGEDKWTRLIQYGIKRGEFREVDIFETVTVILYLYQGIRMWSRIVTMTPDTFHAIISHIEKQLLK